MTEAQVFDRRRCVLGEGPLWHPEREALFWFDIVAGKLMSRRGDDAPEWAFHEAASAAGWVDRDTLLVATASGLRRLDLRTGAHEAVAPLDADDPGTRSNDGRADPQGGFWIGTMGLRGEAERGAIHRYHRGEVRRLFPRITVPNAICFAPDGDLAYFADTRRRTVWRVALDRDGWPRGEPETFLDLRRVGLAPDGAVVDDDGCLWVAQWGAWRVACHGPDGSFRHAVAVGAAHATCPAFGGADRRTLFCTSARQGLVDETAAHHVGAGLTWAAEVEARGQREHRVVL